jgi:hypothetical protein
MYSSAATYSGKFFGPAFFTRFIPLTFLSILYLTIFNEIHFAWDKNINSSNSRVFLLYQELTLIIFSCLYFAAWLFLNRVAIKKENLHHLLIVLSLITNAVFLFSGLNAIGQLREFYLEGGVTVETSLLSIRYFSFAALAILWLTAWKALHFFKPSENLERSFSVVFNITLLSVILNEFIHWMDMAGYQNQYKLGLSLICGAYALALLFTGMVKKKKHLRMAAMILFAGTLLKLFFYDLASLSTISKTIVLVLLGILLLLASFLYNKYKDLLLTKEELNS